MTKIRSVFPSWKYKIKCLIKHIINVAKHNKWTRTCYLRRNDNLRQELLTLPEHPRLPLQFLVWFVLLNLKFSVYCFVDLSFFFWPLYCLFFDWQLLINHLALSSFSYCAVYTVIGRSMTNKGLLDTIPYRVL